jgi:hypothetical protein
MLANRSPYPSYELFRDKASLTVPASSRVAVTVDEVFIGTPIRPLGVLEVVYVLDLTRIDRFLCSTSDSDVELSSPKTERPR